MRLLLSLLVVMVLHFPSARADVPLVYREAARGVREHELLDYFKLIGRYDPALPYTIAAVDLNGDGVEEWIFRQASTPACESDADCPCAIGGLSEGEIVLLGEMRGGKIAVSNEKEFGVRKLLVYNEKNDDFAFQTYAWKPFEQAFRPE